MEQKGYSVSEAVRLVGVESHVLRYWEEELQVEIARTSQGHRVYSQENIEMFRRVRELKERGLQLRAIRVLLDKTGGSTAKAELTEQIFEIGSEGETTGRREKEEPSGETKKSSSGEEELSKGEKETQKKELLREEKELLSGEEELPKEEKEAQKKKEESLKREESKKEKEEPLKGGKEFSEKEKEKEASKGGEETLEEGKKSSKKEKEKEAPKGEGETLKSEKSLKEEEESLKGEAGLVYDVAPTFLVEEDFDKFSQFEEILKRIIGEAVDEKNRRLEQALRQALRDELAQFSLPYREIMSEAAVDREPGDGRKRLFSRLRNLLRKR